MFRMGRARVYAVGLRLISPQGAHTLCEFKASQLNRYTQTLGIPIQRRWRNCKVRFAVFRRRLLLQQPDRATTTATHVQRGHLTRRADTRHAARGAKRLEPEGHALKAVRETDRLPDEVRQRRQQAL